MARQTFTEKRRHMFARKVDRLDVFEQRNMITESLGIAMLGIGIPGVAAVIQSTRRANTGMDRKSIRYTRATTSCRSVWRLCIMPLVKRVKEAATLGRAKSMKTGSLLRQAIG